MANYLVTGARNNTPHITSMDDASFNAGVVGNGAYILKRGENLRAEMTTPNNCRIYDGDFVAQGRHIRIETSDYVDLTINNGSAGLKRNDLIVARYENDAETGIESVDFVVIEGTPSASPTDPEYNEGSIFDGDLIVDFPLYRIQLDGITVADPVVIAEYKTATEFIESGSVFDLDTGIYYCTSVVTGFNTPGGHYVQVFKRSETYKLIVAYDFGSSGQNMYLYWYTGSPSTVVRKKIALTEV